MKFWYSLKESVVGMSHSFIRFPITAIWLVILMVLNAIEIESEISSYSRWVFTCLIGAMLGIVAEFVYERFFIKESHRWALATISIGLAIGYSFLLPSGNYDKIAYSIRTFVLLFALFISFIWIPSIKNRNVLFHQSFLASLKAFFVTGLFAGVLTAGVAAIIGAIGRLLFDVDENILLHILNIIWTLFAPLYFLTLLPQYVDGNTKQKGKDGAVNKLPLLMGERKALGNPFGIPRFVEILLSHIVIPLTAVYTVILLAYVVMNIGGEFWTDNLLEPLLVAYAIIVIIVYLISCNIDNKITLYFRKIFPKIMLPIVLFQTISSVLKIQEMGITYGRYYVILFGAFATVAGIIFSFFPPTKNGFIAITLLTLAFISVIPPIDAFTVARNSQLNLLEETLQNNGMLQNNRILAKSDLPTEEKVLISRSLVSLYDMDEIDRVAYLPNSFEPYGLEMENTFGFPYTYQDDHYNGYSGQSAYLEWQNGNVLFLGGTDYMIRHYINEQDPESFKPIIIDTDFIKYTLTTESSEPYYTIRLLNTEGNEVIAVDLAPLFEQAFEGLTEKAEVTQEEMTWIEENDQVKMTILAMSLEEYEDQMNADVYIFIDIK